MNTMLPGLNLTLLVGGINTNIKYFNIQCLHLPYPVPHYTYVMRAALDANTSRPPLQPGGRTFVHTEGADLRKLAIGVPVVEVVPI